MQSSQKNNFVFKVALAVPSATLFDYYPPENKHLINPESYLGYRVSLYFGKRNLVGIIVGYGSIIKPLKYKIKNIVEILNHPIPKINFNLCLWAKEYYCSMAGHVFVNTLPKLIKISKNQENLDTKLLKSSFYTLSNSGYDQIEIKSLGKKQAEFIKLFEIHASISDKARIEMGFSAQTITTLVNKGLVCKELRDSENTSLKKESIKTQLTPKQDKIYTDILKNISSFHTHLLFGITGSGKTQIYISLINNILGIHNNKAQILLLVPEVALVSPLIKVLASQIKLPVFYYHSNASDKEKAQIWLKTQKNESCVVVGTRSSTFLPMANLKLVIVDEEHDKSYKQTTTSFRYNARDIAIKLAHLHNIPVILGSATPSLISLNNGYSKKYTSHILNARASGVDLPKINFLNTQQLPKGVFLHSLAIENIQKELDKNNKVLLFLNRRGFAPLLQCSQCGWRAKCNKCDSFMVFHKSINKAICHVCNLMKNAPAKCPECKEDKIFQIGIGTQKLEELVKKIFTKTKVVRFDQDSANTSNKMQTEMKKLDNDDPCLIIGTQMLAKGHNIKNLQLVVVVHPDSAFFSGDVFALEDMVQTITQVVGRSGRGNKQGSVIVQTAMPKEFLWKCIAHHDYEGATKYLLKQRKDASLPPFSKMVIFIANAKQSQTAENTLNDLQKNLINIEGAMSFGVMPTTIDKKNNQYYRQLILTGSFSVIQEVKRRGLVYINKSKENIVLDIDPISFSG